MSSPSAGSIKNGVLFGLLQHPSFMQQLQQMQPDKLVPIIIFMIVMAKIVDRATQAMFGLVDQKSLWFGLVNLSVLTIEPIGSYLQMTIGILLVRAILHYVDQNLVGSILTLSAGLVLDAAINYRAPKL